MLVLFIGVCGSGKSSAARRFVESIHNYRLGRKTAPWHFRDADDFHPQANKEKMRAKIPLTDEDREPWIQALEREIKEIDGNGYNLVLAYSGLRRAHRKRLYAAARSVHVVHLGGDPQVIFERVKGRFDRGEHFMPPEQLQNQLDQEEGAGDGEEFFELDISESLTEQVERVIFYLDALVQ